MGDLYDAFSASKFPKSDIDMTPRQEVEWARGLAEDFWTAIKAASPKSICYQIKGNHDDRPRQRLIEKAPDVEAFYKPLELWKFKGVHTIDDPREELILDDIVFMHGFRSQLGQHAQYNQRNTVVGHSHRGGVYYFKNWEKTLWELNCGYLGDPLSKPLSYTKQRFTHWTHGYGYIDDNGPRFIPL